MRLILLIRWLRHRRYLRLLRDTSRCAACQGDALTMLAPDVYRCDACGYEGGEGRGARARARREASLQAMDHRQRRESALGDLREARMLASSGMAELRRARAMIGEALFDDRRVGSTARDHARASGTGQLLQARGKLRDAAVELGLTSSRPAAMGLPYRSTAEPEVLDLTDEERCALVAIVRDATEDDDAKLGLQRGRAIQAAISRLGKVVSGMRRSAATL
ncbi:MAG: hypothetical protein KDK70_42130 [Myxococcales bacterium]|nr:hypothetical protein [Myxococcales bacterium]